MSLYCYACYCWCVSININIYIFLFKTKQLSNLSKLATLPTCNREAVNSNLVWYTRYHDWSTSFISSSCSCSCLNSIPDCPTVRASTTCPITADYSPIHSTPIFPSGDSVLHYTVYRVKVIALTMTASLCKRDRGPPNGRGGCRATDP